MTLIVMSRTLEDLDNGKTILIRGEEVAEGMLDYKPVRGRTAPTSRDR